MDDDFDIFAGIDWATQSHQVCLIDHSGASEVGPWGYSVRQQRGLHVNESAFIAEFLPAREFKDLQQTLAVTATDINTGEAIIIKQGDLLEALQASLAFPGIFSPVRFGQRFLVDGGLCNPIPTNVARNLGAEKIIGVCTIPAV